MWDFVNLGWIDVECSNQRSMIHSSGGWENQSAKQNVYSGCPSHDILEGNMDSLGNHFNIHLCFVLKKTALSTCTEHVSGTGFKSNGLICLMETILLQYNIKFGTWFSFCLSEFIMRIQYSGIKIIYCFWRKEHEKC